MIDNKRPSTAEFSRIAYALYLQRGCEPGMDIEDWTKAEKELIEASSTPVNTSAARSSGTN
jgi:hypothetical protein